MLRKTNNKFVSISILFLALILGIASCSRTCMEL